MVPEIKAGQISRKINAKKENFFDGPPLRRPFFFLKYKLSTLKSL
jgi:hypothetical protein